MPRRAQDRPSPGKIDPAGMLPGDGSAPPDEPPLDPARSHSNDADGDSLVAVEVAPRWIRLAWSVSSKSWQRAAAALGGRIHRARHFIKVTKLRQSDSGPPSSETVLEIEIDPQAREWFLRLPEPHDVWGFELCLHGENRHFSLARTSLGISSGGVRSAFPGSTRPVAESPVDLFREDAGPPPLEVQATLEVFGRTAPSALLTVDDQGVRINPGTGEFLVRFPALHGRNVYAVVASSHGRHRRALLAVDVNVHLLDEEPPEEP